MLRKTVLFCLLIISAICAFSQKPKVVKNYYPSGKIMEQGKLLGSEKRGMWVYYAEAGRIERKENWKKGIRQWTILYNEKNQKVKLIYADGTEKLYKGCNCKN